MTGETPIPTALWREIRDFFAAIVAPCKDCVRGNPTQCWYGDCAAFRFRDLARRIEMVSLHTAVRVPRHVLVENEILDALHSCGIPLYPSQLVLSTTNSKANKRNAIDRLVRQGRIVETRVNDYTRMISLPKASESQKGSTPNEPAKSPCRGGAASRAPSRKLRPGLADSGRSPRAI